MKIFLLICTVFFFIACSAGGGAGGGGAGATTSHSVSIAGPMEQVEQTNEIILSGSQELIIENQHFVLHNNIFLQDQAKLIIRNSIFEHTNDYSFQYKLMAEGSSQVIVENAEIRSSAFLKWTFYDSSRLELRNVAQENSLIWHYLVGSASVVARDSNFKGTLSGIGKKIGDLVQADIRDAAYTEIELVYPAGSVVNESLPPAVVTKVFPNEDDSEMGLALVMENIAKSEWGITVAPQNDITISDAASLVVTFAIVQPWVGVSVELDGLRKEAIVDRTWILEDSRLHLVNVERVQWSPIVGGGNSLTIRNSDINDSIANGARSTLLIENTTTSVIETNIYMDITIRNSLVVGDLIVHEGTVVHLENTIVTGKKITFDGGRIEE